MKKQPDRLLIVDDNELNRDMLARRLAKSGFVISVAESAEQLVERIALDPVDLVLLDIEMPEVSGIEALVKLRQIYAPIQLPIIMVTANTSSSDITNALTLGANDYVTKPIDFPVVLARIKTQLSHKSAEEALRESEERYALAARGANDGLWDWNIQSDTLYFSPRWKAMLGYQQDEIGERPEEWFDRIHDADRERIKAEIATHQEGVTPHFESEYRMLHKDGGFCWMLSRGLAVRDASGKLSRMAGSQTDITKDKVSDPLTGLPNRLLFIDRLGRLFEHLRRQKGCLFGVLFLGLDGFKMVNDSMGHLVGDQLLVAVANRLEKCLRGSDTVTRLENPTTLARLGGDEFTVLLNDLKDPSDATRVADRLLKELSSPFLEEKEIFTTASIGIALSGPRYRHPEDLLRDAETAMHRAKSLGKARYEIFDQGMRTSIMTRLQLENDLRRAIEQKEFRVFYQPIVSLDSGQIVGFEALVRWQHPDRGLLNPLEFIPVAEEIGLIHAIGSWILREACLQITKWNKLSGIHPCLTVSVNISVKQCSDSDLLPMIAELLRELALPPGIVRLEITESMFMTNPSSGVEMLSKIKKLGILLAMDDFGTGYSSLSYLHLLPLDTLKIDRSFISATGKGGDGEEIVRTILVLAKTFGLDVIAEGIETIEQVAFLKELKCEYGQGFYFSKPLAVAGIETLLEQHPLCLPGETGQSKVSCIPLEVEK